MRSGPPFLRRTAMTALGLLYGLFLWVLILPVPAVVTSALMQGATSIIEAGSETFALELSYDAMLALVSLASAIPNSLFVAALAVPTIRRFGCQRWLMYAILFWPLFLHAFHWFYVSYMEHLAAQAGISPGLASFKEHYLYSSKALTIALIYSLFSGLVFLFMRVFGPGAQRPPHDIATPPDGGAPVG